MDRLTSMGAFVRAVESGSFVAAAESLRMSPQMVAKHVARLEARLGATLLNRTTRRQALTDIGRHYYERCKVVVAEAEAADALAAQLKITPAGLLRVNAPVTFGAFSLAPFVNRYLERYPEMQVELTLSDRFVDPLEEGYEVLVRIGELSDSSLIAYPLRPYRLITCAAPDYLARWGTPQTPEDLMTHACLVYGTWSPSTPCRWVFQRQGRSEEVRPDGRFRSNDWKALLQAALAGHGITLGPEDVLQQEIANGRLVRVLPDYEGPSRPLHLLVPARRATASAKISSFVRAVSEAFGEAPKG